MTVGTSNIEAIYPLTPVQEGILFHTLYAPGSPLYFQQYTCVIHGELDTESFQRSWQVVIERHPMLRSLLTWEGRKRPLQIVRSRVTPEWRVEDWSTDTAEGQAARLEEFLEQDRERGFDFEVAPLTRFTLIRTDEEAYQFVWSHHHIVLDGWSLGIVLGELFQGYESPVTGRQPNLPAPPDYRAFVAWSRRQDASAAEEYWRQQLSGFKNATSLRITREEPASPWAERHREVAIQLPRIATTQLVDFARRHGLTLNTVLRGAWAIVLSRYSGNDDVVFGTTFAGRPPELDGSLEMVGLFINTLPVRVRVPKDAPLVDWLHEIQQQQVRAVPFETTPLIDVQGWSDVPKGQPLFQTLLVFENVPAHTAEDGSIRVTQSRYLQRSNYPLAVLVMPGEELELIMVYDADRFDGSLISRMAGQLARVLEAMAGAPRASVVDLPFLPEAEADEILRRWNDTDTEYASELTVTTLIEETIRRLPDAQAVTGAGASLSYRQLAERADTIARHLHAHGVGPNVRVAICLDRSPGMVAAILGVLRAGGAYVPIDPKAPAPRRQFIIENSDAEVLILGPDAISADLRVAGPAGAVPELRIDADGNLLESPERLSTDPTAAGTPSGPDDLVYVMHTSGSTGRPKGVAVTQRSLVNSTQARTKVYREHVGAFLLMSPFFFDSSVAGIFWTLAQGGTLVLPEPAMEQDVHHIASLIRDHGVTHTLMLPSIYELLLEHAPQGSLRSLREVVVAGEACSSAVVRRHFDTLPRTLLYNEYGPTEATVWGTVQELRTEHANPGANSAAPRVPIGRPIPNTTAFVLDERLRPAPVGVPESST